MQQPHGYGSNPPPPPPGYEEIPPSPPPVHHQPMHGAAVRRDDSKPLVALIMGIAGLILLPIVGSIAALVIGYQVREQAKRDGMALDPKALWGLILGWGGIGLWVLIFMASAGSA